MKYLVTAILFVGIGLILSKKDVEATETIHSRKAETLSRCEIITSIGKCSPKLRCKVTTNRNRQLEVDVPLITQIISCD